MEITDSVVQATLPRRYPLMWVEGIIGCGKTTFCIEVGKRLGFRVICEPVDNAGLNDEAIDSIERLGFSRNTNPYLKPFYKNPQKWAFSMQIYLLHQRYLQQQLAAIEATGVGGYKGAILDRSLSGDRVFAKLHRVAGNIEPLDWANYEMCYDNMCRTLLPPTKLIYLDVSPRVALERIKRRKRDAETGIPLEYLQDLHRGYDELIREAEYGLLPWAHAVKVDRRNWDPIIVDEDKMPDWDNIAAGIAESCKPVNLTVA
jgi:deoxyadenosine/deoxycytidine kinase